MGKLKSLLADASECLQVPIEEVMEMSLVELNTLLEQRIKGLEQAESEIDKQIEEVDKQIKEKEQEISAQMGWDVDVDEDGPFICIAEK